MISDWFHDRIPESGHHSLEKLGYRRRGRIYFTPTLLLDRIRREHDFCYVLSVEIDNRIVVRSELIMETIETEDIFFGPWASFRDETKIYFVFMLRDAATRFKLMLPD